jgi:uncharacterized protein (TIGR00251 family)
MTDLDIRETPDGAVIAVNVRPKAKQEGITGIHDGALKIGVNAPPEKGKANSAVISVLAKVLGMAKENIELHAGATSRKKKFIVYGISKSEVEKILNDSGLLE